MTDKERFIQILGSTKREGIDKVLENLERRGFFKAPASSVNHLNSEGGLLAHSLNTYDGAMIIREGILKTRPELEGRLPLDSVALATLLHDVCKTELYKKTTKMKKNNLGGWTQYSGWDADYSTFPVGHGEKSVIMLLLWGLSLTEDEMLAIRWHMGAWELPMHSFDAKSQLNAAKKQSPLCSLVQAADSVAAGLIEF